MIQVPNIQKKEYTIVDLFGCDFITLRDDNTGKTRNDLKLKEDWDITGRILDKYNGRQRTDKSYCFQGTRRRANQNIQSNRVVSMNTYLCP